MTAAEAATLLIDTLGPKRSGSGAEVLRSLAVLKRADRARQRIDALRSNPSPGLACYGTAVAETLDQFSADGLLAAFDSPQAGWDLDTDDWPLETVTDRRDPATVDAALWRHLAGLPMKAAVHLVPPPSHRPISLPHLGLVVHATGPIAVFLRPDGGLRIVWIDGFAVTLPAAPTELESDPAAMTAGRVGRLPTWQARPVEPATADIRDAFALFRPVTDAGDRSQVLHAQCEAQQLLQSVWPETAESVEIWLRGWMPLACRDGARSHSSPRLPGIILTSATDLYQAADLLCHETAHMRLGAALAHDPLLHNGLTTGFPSPWRSDSRPLYGLLLGVHAFLDVCRFHQRVIDTQPGHPQSDISATIASRQAGHVKSAWATLAAVADPTPLGQTLLSKLEQEVERL